MVQNSSYIRKEMPVWLTIFPGQIFPSNLVQVQKKERNTISWKSIVRNSIKLLYQYKQTQKLKLNFIGRFLLCIVKAVMLCMNSVPNIIF